MPAAPSGSTANAETTGEVTAVRRRARRSDSVRNVAAILDAAQACLTRDSEATVAQIAEAAGVGRVTLYGHFGTRAELVGAVFARIVERADGVLDSVDTSGEPREALVRLVAASWQLVHQQRAVLHAAERELPQEGIRAHHDRHFVRFEALLARGQEAGAFRTDVPRGWLLTTCFSLIHAAADDVNAGRLQAGEAERALLSTLLASLTPPGVAVPELPADPGE